MEEAAVGVCAFNLRLSMVLFGKIGTGKRECRILAFVDANRHLSTQDMKCIYDGRPLDNPFHIRLADSAQMMHIRVQSNIYSSHPHPRSACYKMLHLEGPPSKNPFFFFFLPPLRGRSLSPGFNLSISLICRVALSLRMICLQRSTNASSTFRLALADVS